MNGEELTGRVREMYESFASGDADRYRAAFAPGIVWHVPGDNPVSGRYEGEAYFTDMPSRMAPLDDWRIAVTDVLVNEKDRVALVHFHVNGARKGMTVDMDGYHLVRLDDDGRVIEGWGFASDQAALDRFFSA